MKQGDKTDWAMFQVRILTFLMRLINIIKGGIIAFLAIKDVK